MGRRKKEKAAKHPRKKRPVRQSPQDVQFDGCDYLPECDPINHSPWRGDLPISEEDINSESSKYAEFPLSKVAGPTPRLESNTEQQSALGQHHLGVEGTFNSSNNSAMPEPLMPPNGQKLCTPTLKVTVPILKRLSEFNLPEPAIFNDLSGEGRAKILEPLPPIVKYKYQRYCCSYALNQLLKESPVDVANLPVKENGIPPFKAAIERPSRDIVLRYGKETPSFVGNAFASGTPNSASKSSVLTRTLGKDLSSATSVVGLNEKSGHAQYGMSGKSTVDVSLESSMQPNTSAFAEATTSSGGGFPQRGNHSENGVTHSLLSTPPNHSPLNGNVFNISFNFPQVKECEPVLGNEAQCKCGCTNIKIKK